MSDNPAGPRPPSDPRLDEAVPQQSRGVERERQPEAQPEAGAQPEVGAEAVAEGAIETGGPEITEAAAPLRPFTWGRDASYVPLDEEPSPEGVSAEAVSAVAPSASDLAASLGGIADEAEVPDMAAPDLVAQVRGDNPRRRSSDYPAPVAQGASTRVAADTGETVAVAAPVATLGVDLRPNNGSEPFRRVAILAAALFLLVGVVLFREWSNDDSSGTASSDQTTDEAAAETSVQALVSTPEADTETDGTDTDAADDAPTTVDEGESSSSEEPSAQPSEAETDEAGDSGGPETEVSAPSVDPDAARGLLESEQITLTGVVRSEEEADALVAQLESVVGEGNVSGAALTINPLAAPLEQLTLLVRDELGFTPGSDTIEASFFPVLDRLIGLFELLPSVVIAVEGHTDSSGLDYENLALSQRRAEAVVEYIVDSGVNSFRLEPQGRGSTSPIAENETAAGRALNRRIEFIVFGLDLTDT